MWDEIGRLQFDFLVAKGLAPEHRLLDVGCGSLRGGVHFARYLAAGHYYGIDLNESLIEAGYEAELRSDGLHNRVPRENLRQSSDFDFAAFNVRFDYALGLSLFTHLSLNTIRTCLERLGPVMRRDGRFFVTVFELADDRPSWRPIHHDPGGISTYGDRDPYHYRQSDIAYIAESAGWSFEWIGAFGHPRDQQMVCFRPAKDGR
jgi:SAM-dependent methyltransferase